jgi:hypothetical protein
MKQPHRRGERVTVFWPGGPYDFAVEFDFAEPLHAEGWDGWFVLHGTAEPTGGERHRWYPMRRSFYVHAVEGGYALVRFRN